MTLSPHLWKWAVLLIISKVPFYPADAEDLGGPLFKNIGIKADFHTVSTTGR